MDPLYKVGDQVIVKDKYDNGCNSSSYKFYFTGSMKRDFGGKVCTIKSIRESVPVRREIPDDGYLYHLVEDNNLYNWASSMFESEF